MRSTEESALLAIAAGAGVDVRDRVTLWRERVAQDRPMIELVRSADVKYGVIQNRTSASRARITAHRRRPAGLDRGRLPHPSWTLRPGESVSSRVDEALSIINASAGTHAFVGVFAEEARADARALDERARAGDRMGALYGAIVAVKDIISVRGWSMSGGSRALRCPIADQDAEIVRRLRSADGVLIGTTNLHALAYGPFSTSSDSGPVRNPLRPDAVAGGSSGGSAAALVVGAVDLAVGTDTAGSIRIPGALCAVVGLKGTYGEAPMAGVHPLAPSLDHVGPMARSVTDAAVGWEVLSGMGLDPALRVRESLQGIVVADLGDAVREGLDPPVRAAFDSALETAVSLGARVRHIDLPDLHRAAGVMLCTIGPEALDVHRELLRDRATLLPEDVRLRLEASIFVQASDYVRAQRLRVRLAAQLNAALEVADVVLLPTVPIIAPALDALEGKVSDGAWTTRAAMSRFTLLGNLTGHPAVTIPWARDHAGAGIGIQLIGAHRGEAEMLSVGSALEHARHS
ncbi:MAG: amidase [Ornithinimicrobium sp.]